jgi:hypothetical protein
VAQYGRGVGIIQMTAAQIITQFAANLKAQLGPAAAAPATPTTPAATAAPAIAPAASSAASAAPMPPAKPISAVALAGAVLLAWIKRLFGRK